MRVTTGDLPGTGGLIKAVPEDFRVDELPAYAPEGSGDHTFVYVEKRALTTEQAAQALARALGVSRAAVGVAGQKDRQAVTRQWMSLPGVDPERALGLTLDGVRVLEATRHRHKLRTGHLDGNRFTIVLRGVACGTTEGLERARAILARLGRDGLPNYFGAQRFGARGDNAARGRALVLGERRGQLGASERRLLVSAFQSELFNRALDARIDDRLLTAVLDGDIMKKRDTGGLFIVGAAERDDAADGLAAGALAITGPMFGHKMLAPPPDSEAGRREQALLDQVALDPAAFARLGKLAEGTRRPFTVAVADATVEPGDEPEALVLRFTLPPGAYATVMLAEVTKAEVTKLERIAPESA